MKYTLPKNAVDLALVPPNTTELDCSECKNLTSLDGLPEGLETLNCSRTKVTSLEGLPQSLMTLDCSWCQGLIQVQGLPLDLKHLDCSECKALVSIVLPPALETLDCSWCVALTALPDLPLALRTLVCLRCKVLAYIGPGTLETLDLRNCKPLYVAPQHLLSGHKFRYQPSIFRAKLGAVYRS